MGFDRDVSFAIDSGSSVELVSIRHSMGLLGHLGVDTCYSTNVVSQESGHSSFGQREFSVHHRQGGVCWALAAPQEIGTIHVNCESPHHRWAGVDRVHGCHQSHGVARSDPPYEQSGCDSRVV